MWTQSVTEKDGDCRPFVTKLLALNSLENATRRKMNLLVCICCKRASASILVWPEPSANSLSVSNTTSYRVKTRLTDSDYELYVISMERTSSRQGLLGCTSFWICRNCVSVGSSHEMQWIYNIKKVATEGGTFEAVERTRFRRREWQCTYTAWGNVFLKSTCTPALPPDMTATPSKLKTTHNSGSSCSGSRTYKILLVMPEDVIWSVATNQIALSLRLLSHRQQLVPSLSGPCIHQLKWHNRCYPVHAILLWFFRGEVMLQFQGGRFECLDSSFLH